MSEIKKKKIVLASVLKPVDDTRMFEKMAKSLAALNQFEIFIIGFPTQRNIDHQNITTISYPYFKRLSITRLAARWKYFRHLLTIKPDVIIFNTHELIVPSLLYKAIFRIKIIYDIQENYFRNILFIPVFPIYLRPLIAVYVRTKEILLSAFINHFILAENGYTKELGFIKQAYTVVENKAIKSNTPFGGTKIKTDTIKLLFSGTLAQTTGIFEAIELSKKLHQLDSTINLTIIGYCAQPAVLQKIKNEIREHQYITLIGGDALVPHQKIIDEINKADFGIISYPPNPSTENRIPTKLFEYLGAQLPILITSHPIWVNRCMSYNACVPLNFSNPDYQEILNRMRTGNFYTALPSDVFWEEEFKRLAGII